MMSDDTPSDPPEKGPRPAGGHTFQQEVQHSPATARVPDAVGRGLFSTGAIVMHGAHDVLVDFIQSLAPPRRVVARVVLPPNAGPIALYTIALYNQPISDFWFRYPRIAGDDPRTYQSEILTGQLQILDTGAKIKLQPRELILLEGGSRMLSRLEIIDKAVAVDVSGEANRISVGPPRPGSPFSLDRDLTPSVLSYLLNQHELKVLWGIALTLLGALWKARQWALKWAK